jgi:hypothetical protein
MNWRYQSAFLSDLSANYLRGLCVNHVAASSVKASAADKCHKALCVTATPAIVKLAQGTKP